jgi:hypothetical protein
VSDTSSTPGTGDHTLENAEEGGYGGPAAVDPSVETAEGGAQQSGEAADTGDDDSGDIIDTDVESGDDVTGEPA